MLKSETFHLLCVVLHVTEISTTLFCYSMMGACKMFRIYNMFSVIPAAILVTQEKVTSSGVFKLCLFTVFTQISV